MHVIPNIVDKLISYIDQTFKKTPVYYTINKQALISNS